eukprot:1159483-Pelagomonas_calceolata.AAC.6
MTNTVLLTFHAKLLSPGPCMLWLFHHALAIPCAAASTAEHMLGLLQEETWLACVTRGGDREEQHAFKRDCNCCM